MGNHTTARARSRAGRQRSGAASHSVHYARRIEDEGVGAYRLTSAQGGALEIRATRSGEHIAFHLTASAGAYARQEAAQVIGTQAAKSWLAARGWSGQEVRLFVGFAAQDALHYTGEPTAQQQARIAAVSARRTALNQQFGSYSHGRAYDASSEVLARFPALRLALEEHMANLDPLSVESVVRAIGRTAEGRAQSTAQRAQTAHDALTALRQVTEWALLHQSNTTREGTIRLFRGLNTDAHREGLRAQTVTDVHQRGVSFTDKWQVARDFAERGPGAAWVISAQVPVESVLSWGSIRPHNTYGPEEEYIVGDGPLGASHLIPVEAR